jgi:hypothetical protein
LPNTYLGDEVKAVVQLEPGIASNPGREQELIAFCYQALVHFKVHAIDGLRGRNCQGFSNGKALLELN